MKRFIKVLPLKKDDALAGSLRYLEGFILPVSEEKTEGIFIQRVGFLNPHPDTHFFVRLSDVIEESKKRNNILTGLFEMYEKRGENAHLALPRYCVELVITDIPLPLTDLIALVKERFNIRYDITAEEMREILMLNDHILKTHKGGLLIVSKRA